jgi:glycosyltransferase involved in cell wall biosynthesis
LVTTIIPVYGRPVLLREAVESVLSQTYRPIEVIIVDDGSIDETALVANALARDYASEGRVIHQANGGPGVARETGRLLAHGEFIQYLDSDDLLLRRKFDLQVTGLRANPSCDVSYGQTRHADSGNQPWKRTGEKIETMFPAFLGSRWWGTSSPLYRRRIIDEAGPWTSLWHEEDWEYDCRIAALGVRLDYCNHFVSEQRTVDAVRLSGNVHDSARKLQDRARAHELIFSHAEKAGIQPDVPEMQHFARELFLLARQCGAAALPREAEALFKLALAASSAQRRQGWDFRGYQYLARLAGWQLAGRIACFSDRVRSVKQPTAG